MREVVERFDFCSYLVVAVFAYVVARRAGQLLPRYAAAMWWAALAVLLTVAAWGYVEIKPARPFEAVGVAVIAGIAACAAALATVVILAPVGWLKDRWASAIAARQARADGLAAQRRREEEERRQMEERQREGEARLRAAEERRRSMPPPLTREERVAQARTRYEEAVRLLEAAGLDEAELQAGREQAKQEYLRELHEVMK